PTRVLFKEPDAPEIALKCDMCGDEPLPMCVKWCMAGALTYVEREEED
ncbi:MAG: (4Fe-4S)-binding protein, partial [Chloroflexi bacterium]|nr:(4Fe-4S)-binding protein [Chloroflexota bacterium]